MHSNCNNKFEVYHYHASVFMICIPTPSERALVYCYDLIIILSQNLCVYYLIGDEIIKNLSLDLSSFKLYI